MKTITIVGAGRLGTALALAFDRAGYEVVSLIYRSTVPSAETIGRLSRAASCTMFDRVRTVDSDVLLICTQDTEIEDAARKLSGKTSARVVLHTSGSLPSSLLESLKDASTSIGSLHPLVSVSDPIIGADKFSGSYFCIEGDPEAVQIAGELASAIGGKTFTIPTQSKPLYHAAAVMASGHLVALIETSARVLERFGVSGEEARVILAPLIASTLDNLNDNSAAVSMTGPYARLDAPAFRRHLSALEEHADELTIDIYLDLAARSLEIVRSAVRDPEAADALRKEVFIAKRKRRMIK